MSVFFSENLVTPLVAILFPMMWVDISLNLISFMPLVAILILMVMPSYNVKPLNMVNLYVSLMSFLVSLLLLLKMDCFWYSFYTVKYFYFSEWINWPITVGLDNISMLFIVLTNLLFLLCFLYNYNNVYLGSKNFSMYLHMMQFFLNQLFLTTNLFWFFVYFECVLIPMFFIMGIWGSRLSKIHATYYFYLYTLFGSLFMFFAVLMMYFLVGSGEFSVMETYLFPKIVELILFLFFFYSFAIKVPIMPVHIWLPEAHVEAPTTGSVLLAGMLLKLGTYGILRILLPVFPYACIAVAPLIYLIASMGIIYCSFSILRQIDLKKIIAYSSVIHMNFALMGLFSFKFEGFLGSMFLMINHGIVSSGLFFCMGMLYERYHTRIITYYSGLNLVMPQFALMFLILCLANMGFPGTSSFVGEFLMLLGTWDVSVFLTYLTNFSMISSVCYVLWTANSVLFGPLKFNKTFSPLDLTWKELSILVPLIMIVFLFGIYPNFFFEKYEVTLAYYYNYLLTPYTLL